jgi:hypothetical protein
MAMNVPNLPENREAEHKPTGTRRRAWGCVALCSCCAGLAAIFGRMFFLSRAKFRKVPIIHESVSLTPEGAEVWQKAMDSESPVGKPVAHHRRRLANGDVSP